MQLEALLKYKSLYKITGTPENFLTALRFMQWGFNDKNYKSWKKIQTGDIVCFHSKAEDSKFIKKGTSCVIGFGIVGNIKFETKELLWIEEFENQQLMYPYHFNFSEITFFTDVIVDDTWDSQTLNKRERTAELINKLLQNGIPLRELPGFNQMGSFSILKSVNSALLFQKPKVFSVFDNENDEVQTNSPLEKVELAEEIFRKATSLSVSDEVQQKIINKKSVTTTKDLTLLERAEKEHFETLQRTLLFFKDKGFETYSNKYVDLFAIKNDESFLVEVKSLENRNFRSQMRKAIAQLFEYNYFEIQNFQNERNILELNNTNLLVTSRKPTQKEYINFINSLKIEMAYRDNDGIVGIGTRNSFI
ncbi:hypothetical protein WG954_03895 [Lacibacter sp. H375]|uniref:hypothetical protein n=1 Tax=Lacibacter sp. H375 TaxID=3133424 RepID=UPI0030BCD02C